MTGKNSQGPRGRGALSGALGWSRGNLILEQAANPGQGHGEVALDQFSTLTSYGANRSNSS